MTSSYHLSPKQEEALLKQAWEVRRRSHSPYSKFPVGAALLTDSGDVVVGCNVESASFGASVCAERNAIASAIAQGFSKFTAIAVVADSSTPTPPCGICRQVLAEFGTDVSIVFANNTETKRRTLSELLPDLFDYHHLLSTWVGSAD